MKRVFLVLSLMGSIYCSKAQVTSLRALDSVIQATIVQPIVDKAVDEQTVPDWSEVSSALAAANDATVTDRNLNKAQIYYYYYKDWPAFTAALVRYTEKYEDKKDARLMNKNAQYVLEHSVNQGELSLAQSWMRAALAVEPSNADYQKTASDLRVKLIKMNTFK